MICYFCLSMLCVHILTDKHQPCIQGCLPTFDSDVCHYNLRREPNCLNGLHGDTVYDIEGCRGNVRVHLRVFALLSSLL